MKNTCFCAPEAVTSYERSIFLAGSIEMGKAAPWQDRFMQLLDSENALVFLNPRRAQWDASWKQEISFAPFREQVEWELNCLEKASCIALYLQSGTYSPISLLELGIFSQSKKLIVFCEEGFWRKGNVDIVCQRYGITQVDSLEALAAQCLRFIKASK